MTVLYFQIVDPTREPMGSLSAQINTAVCAWYSGRDQATFEGHVEDLKSVGSKRPFKVPFFHFVSPYLATAARQVIVQGARTSREVEFATIHVDREAFVTVCSDHTDRALDRLFPAKAKQICAKALYPNVIPYMTMESIWNKTILRSYYYCNSEYVLYQEGRLEQLLPLETLQERCPVSVWDDGVALLSGTIPTLDKEIKCSVAFAIEMELPSGFFLRYQYDLVQLHDAVESDLLDEEDE